MMMLSYPAKFRPVFLAGLIAGFSAVAGPPALAAEIPAVLSGLVGSWRGDGVAHARSGGDNENVSCRARYTDMEADQSLRVEVTCVALNAKGTLVGFIEYGAGTPEIVGSWYQNWSTSEGEENGSLTGSLAASSITLNVSAAGSVRARLKISLTNSNEHKVSLVGIVDGKEEQGMDVVFRR